MAKTTQEAQVTEAISAVGEAAMRQLDEAGFGSLRWMGTTWFETMADMNSEVVTFLANRIKEDVKTQHKLLHCTSAEDLQAAQLAFLKKAYAQYADETGKLIKMGMEMLPVGPTRTKHTPV